MWTRLALPESPSTSTSTLVLVISGSGGTFLLDCNKRLLTCHLSSEFAKAKNYPGHTIYNPANSSTAKTATGTWKISYGDGSSASGDVHDDTITVGDIVVPGQAIELAKTLSSSFLQDDSDGLLGVSPSTRSPMHAFSLLNLLYSVGLAFDQHCHSQARCYASRKYDETRPH
jgi:Eukaryotic aspartyl protease